MMGQNLNAYAPMRGDKKQEQIDAILARLDAAEKRICALERENKGLREYVDRIVGKVADGFRHIGGGL